MGGLNCWSIHRTELGKWVRELFHSRRIQWRPVKGLAPNSEAAGLQSFLVSENCLNIKSTDKAKWGLCSNIDIWGLEDCKRKEGNKNGYTLRVSLFYWKRPSKVQRRRKISKRFFLNIAFSICLTQISINNRYRAGEMTPQINVLVAMSDDL